MSKSKQPLPGNVGIGEKISREQRDGGSVIEGEPSEKDILLSLTKDIASLRDKKDILHILHPRIKELFQVDDVFICFLDRTNDTLNPFLRWGSDSRNGHQAYAEVVKSNLPIRDGFIDSILKETEPIVVDITEVEARPNRPDYAKVFLEVGLVESLSQVLYDNGQQIGILTLWSEKKDFFNRHHCELIRRIADPISIVVGNILSNDAILRRERENEMLLQVSNEIAAIRNKDDLTRIIGCSLKKYLQFDDSAITVYSKERNTYRVYAYHVEETRLRHAEFQGALATEYPVNDNNLQSSHTPTVVDLDLLEGGGAVEFIKKVGIREFATVKLVDGDKLVGLFVLLSEKKKTFTESSLYIMQRISYQISIAIAKLLANEEIGRREEEKSILLSLSNDMALVRSAEDMTKVINDKLKKLFSIDDYTIVSLQENNLTYGPYLFDEQSKYFEKKREYLDTLYSNFKFEPALYDVVLESDSPVVFNIAEIMNRDLIPGHIRFFNSLGIKEVVGSALRIGNENIGVLWIQPEQMDCFHLVNQNVFRGVCSQISIALANIVANEEIQRKEQEKSVLLSLSNEIATVRDKDDLFHVVDSKLKELFSVQGFAIGLISEDGRSHQPYMLGVGKQVGSHPDFQAVSSQQYSVNDGVFDFTLNSTKPVEFNVNELSTSGDVPLYVRFWKSIGIHTIVGVALRVGKKDLGCLFFHLESHMLGNLRNNLLQGVCSQISIALSNILANERIASHLAEIKGYKEQLEKEKLYLQEEVGSGYTYDDIIGSSAEMQRVFHLLSQVSFTNSTVLLLGETGTGKELIARAIHNTSSRKDKLMVKVNCASIPSSLIESELFGHEKGAFTGAVERRIGKFELASKGTLFLDEIGELPMDMQAKLLRVLQEKEIERVGGKDVIQTDARIIAATNRNLEKEVLEGKFRSDLYYRLNVFPITIPPLRDRKEDIPLLASFFVGKFSKNSGKKINTISTNVVKVLQTYSWPGNVRELEHLVERSVLTTFGNTIKEVHLPTDKFAHGKSLFEPHSLKTHEENERDHILFVLKECKGKIYGQGGAAERLGLKVSTLNSKIKKLGIKKESDFEQ